ncbi:MAG: stage II sporulation protein M [Actinomycetota bacterium]
MKLDAFIAAREPRWRELESAMSSTRGRLERLEPARIVEVGSLYRATVADLAIARASWPADPVVRRLESLVTRARALVYGAQTRRGSLGRFFASEYWSLVASTLPLIGIAWALMLGPALVALWWAAHDPHAALTLLPGIFSRGPQSHGPLSISLGQSAVTSSQIFTNNIRVTFLAFAGGVTFGLLTAGSLAYNGLILGVVGGAAANFGVGSNFVELVAPHGFLELSCIAVAGGAGLGLARALLKPGRLTRGAALRGAARPSILIVLGTAPWLVIAGLVEGFITPRAIGTMPALGFGVGLAAIYWLLVWRLGRGSPATDAPWI